MVDIFMGLGSFRLMLDAAKNLKNISDPDIRNDAVVALHKNRSSPPKRAIRRCWRAYARSKQRRETSKHGKVRRNGMN
jgi:hypothetical protein